MRKTILLSLAMLLLSLGVCAQSNYSDIVDINELVKLHSNFWNGGNPDAVLKGYKSTGWIRVEGLGPQNKSLFYYRNCTLDSEGEPKTFSKGNSSVVEFGNAGFGSFTRLAVYNVGAFNFICKQLENSGFRKESTEMFKKGEVKIELNHYGKTYSFMIQGSEEAEDDSEDMANTVAGDDTIEDNAIYGQADQAPSFPGGDAAFKSYIMTNLKYPLEAQENGLQGRVIVSVVVEKDGSLSNIRVFRSVAPSLDKDALRIVAAMPKWNVGVKNGKTIRVKQLVPITFIMQ